MWWDASSSRRSSRRAWCSKATARRCAAASAPSSTLGEPVEYRTDGPGELTPGIGLLRLDDGTANAMQDVWLRAMNAALDRAEADPIRALVVTGRPGFLSAGLDLKTLPRLAPPDLARTTGAFIATMKRVFLFPKPVVVASPGHAIAGGMMLYLAADVRIALDRNEARYGLNEAANGIPLLGGTLGICQNAIPSQHHTELILHGRMLTASETFERGITHALVATDEALLPCARERALALCALEPSAYRINKRLLRETAWDAAARAAETLVGESPGAEVFTKLGR